MDNYRMLIDGKWVGAASGATFPVMNPANGEKVADAPLGAREDALSALKAASRAFPAWAALSFEKRAELMHKSAALLRERRDAIAHTLSLEQGKPINQAKGEIAGTADALDYFAEAGRLIKGEIIPTTSPKRKSLVVKEPVGVVAAIGPWNFPILLLSWKIAPALAAGCTVVSKPSSLTPLAVIEFHACFKDAGIPDGVINCVVGPGDTVGQELVENPLSKKIGFTGNSATGKDIMRRASASLKKLTLELGNNAPMIICEDTDVPAAAKAAAKKSFDNMGQICNSANRIYVQRTIADEFITLMVKAARAMVIANGCANPAADLGPMVSAKQLAFVQEHIADAVKRGAKVLCGGEKPAGKEFEKGHFFQPTVLSGVTHEMRIMKEETFGPVAPVMVFDEFEKVIALANDTPYGLVAYVYTNDARRIAFASEKLEFGTVDFNNVSGGHHYYPYAGWKDSGVGIELSEFGLEEYLRVKHVRIDL
ncbi:MAG: NAD-dependent succinate-semialdehyde dehydrogenase [Spirochaetia bacterium]|jgi:acyl-CoA reductase-like NAD-dependent aldehyde dehydrogenase